MSVNRIHYDLEVIFGLNEGSTVAVPQSEQLYLHKEFHSCPQNFTLYGVTLDALDTDILLGIVIRVFQLRSNCSAYQNSSTYLARGLFATLQQIVRKRLCPHTRSTQVVGNWDALLYDVIERCVFPSHALPAWKRLYKQLLQTDLETPNFDGTGQTVMRIHALSAQLVEAVQSNDVSKLHEALQACDAMASWFSPRCVKISALGDWSLLHLAASVPTPKEVYTVLVQEVGCEVQSVDARGRTALHVAASALNADAVECFNVVSPTVNRIADSSGEIPLQLLMRTVALCPWRKRVSSLRLQQMITALIPATNRDIVWHVEHHSPAVSQQQCALSARSCLFYHAVVHTDDVIAQEVIRIAKLTPRDHWNASAIEEATYTCIRDPRGRLATVELLLQETWTSQVSVDGSKLLDFLDTCLCHALVSAKHAKSDKAVVKALLERVTRQLSTFDVVGSARGPFAFVYLAVMSKDPVLLTIVLAALPRTAVTEFIFPASARRSAPESVAHHETDEYRRQDNDRFRRILSRFLPLDADAAVWSLLQHRHMSPMSLACALGSAEMVNTMQRACYVAPGQRAPASRGVLDQQLQADHFHPANFCLAAGASDCFRLIRNMHTVESFYELCFSSNGTGTTLFATLLEVIGNELRTSTVELKGCAECLRIMLDCVPAKLSPAASVALKRALYGAVSADTTVGADTATHAALLKRLCMVQSALKTIAAGLSVDEKWDTLVDKTAPAFLQTVSKFDQYEGSRLAVQAQVQSSYFQTSLRLIGKRFTPDKKWIKLAYCLTRLMKALGINTPGSAHGSGRNSPADSTGAGSGASPSVIDLSSWQEFASVLSKASKSNEQLRELCSSLVVAQDKVLSPMAVLASGAAPHTDAHNEELTEECAIIQAILEDNQIPVLLKYRRESPFGASAEESEAVTPMAPHYQVNDFKPDHRMASAYSTLFDWVARTLRSIALRSEFHSQALPVVAAAGASEMTALAYFQCRMLRTEQAQLETLLAFPPSSSTSAKSLLDLLRLRTASDGPLPTKILPAALRNELERAGICTAQVQNYIKDEQVKQSRRKMAEKILCVLIESNDRLGGDLAALGDHVLTLCAMHKWDAVRALVREFKNQPRRHSGAPSNMIFLAQRWQSKPGMAGAATALVHYERSVLRSSSDDSATAAVQGANHAIALTPLHLAILSGQDSFVQEFIEAFPEFPVDLEGLTHFATEHALHNSLSALLLVSANLRSDMRVCTVHRSAVAWDKAAEGMSNDVSASRSRQIQALVRTAVAGALHTAHNDHHDVSSVFPPFVMDGEYELDASGMPASHSKVRLMDGSLVSWKDMIVDAQQLARALPAPLRAGGLFGTGHTVLHQACKLPSSELAVWMLQINADWRRKIFQVDSTGATPLSCALEAGHFDLVSKMLEWAHEGNKGVAVDLCDLNLLHSSCGSSSSVNVRTALLLQAKEELRALELEYFVPADRTPHQVDQHPRLVWIRAMPAPKYGLRGYKVASPVDALARYLHGVEELWLRITTSDPDLLSKVCVFPGCGQLDSVIRARQALSLLGIPLSQLAVQIKDLRGANTGDATRTRRATRDYTDLSPRKLRKLVSLPTSQQLKSIVCGWYRQRSKTTPSVVDDSTFLHRTCDVSVVELGQGGSELSGYLRRHASFVRACDRVRSQGVPTNEKAQVFATLCEQMKMEFRFDNSSASRENMLRRGNAAGLDESTAGGATGAKVLSILQSMQVDAVTCANILSLSYLILDFARLLCVARQLVVATTLPASPTRSSQVRATLSSIANGNLQGSGEMDHPLDVLHSKLSSARRCVDQLERVLVVPEATVASFRDEGVMSRIKICDFLTTASLQQFFQLDATKSERFTSLRAFLVEGLSNMLQDRGEFQLSEFVCRYLATARETAPSPAQDGLASGRVQSKHSRITDSEIGIQKIMNFLQQLRVADLVNAGSNAFENNRTLRFSYAHSSKLKDLEQNAHICFQGTADDNLAGQARADHPAELVLRDITAQSLAPSMTAYSAKREQARQAEHDADLWASELNNAYSVACVIFRLISAAAHLPTEADFYDEDVHQLVSASRLCNPLLALCRSSFPSDHIKPHHHLLLAREKRSRVRLQIECCKRLLAMGAVATSGFAPVECPIMCAAVNGRADLLSVFLEQLSQVALRDLPGYNTLVWQLLCLCAKAPAEHVECLRLLLSNQFPAESPPNCQFSALELAALLGLSENDMMLLCAARGGSCHGDSVLRVIRILVMRGSTCPVNLVELLLRRLNSDDKARLLTEPFSLAECMSTSGFVTSVIEAQTTFLAPFFSATRAEGTTEIVRSQVSTAWAAATVALRDARRRNNCNNGSSSLADRDISSCADDLLTLSSSTGAVESAAPPTVFMRTSFMDLLTTARNNLLCKTVLPLLSAELLSSMHLSDLGGDPMLGVSSTEPLQCPPISVARVLSTVSVHDGAGFLATFEALYTSWRTSQGDRTGPSAECKTAETTEVDEGISSYTHPVTSPIPSWVEMLNRATQCSDLRGPACTPVEAAIVCNSTNCVDYLLTKPGLRITFSCVIAALVKGKILESTALRLLKHLLPSRHDVDHVVLEYDSLGDFLSTLQHCDQQGGSVVTGETLLHVCCRRGYASIVEHLLVLGANPLLPDANNCTALLCSIAAGHSEVTKVMYAHCPDSTRKAVSVLVYATRKYLLRRMKCKQL